MSYTFAPYNDSMRLGQGFNSYKQQACIDHAVDIQVLRVQDPKLVSQVVSYSARIVESLSDVVDGMNGSYYSSIKRGTVEVTGSTTTVNENVFKTSDLNAVISVKVTNQGLEVVSEKSEFKALADSANILAGGAEFNDMYGDSYISGFLTGGEFTGIVSIKVIDRANREEVVNTIKSALTSQKENPQVVFSPVDSESTSSLLSAMKSTETTIAVSWMGGGQIKPPETAWDLASVLAAAAAFPARVAECPQRTWAILTKYKANRSFVEHAKKAAFQLLEYDQIHSYTAELFDQYMDYKVFIRTVQEILDNIDAYEKSSCPNALEPNLPTLLSVKAIFRQEQAKIVRAVEALSKDPGILLRKSGSTNVAIPDPVAKIIDSAMGEGQAKALYAGARPSTNSASSSVAVPQQGEVQLSRPNDVAAPGKTSGDSFADVEFSKLIPSEVWTRALPLKKAAGGIASDKDSSKVTPGLPSLDGFIFGDAAIPKDNFKPALEPLVAPVDASSQLCLEPNKLTPTALAWTKRYAEFAKSYKISAPLGTGSSIWPVHLFDQCCGERFPRPKDFSVAFNEDGWMTSVSIEFVNGYGPLRAVSTCDESWSSNNSDIDRARQVKSLKLKEIGVIGSVDETVSMITIEAGKVNSTTTAPIRLQILTSLNRLLDWTSSKYVELKDAATPALDVKVPQGYTFHSFWFQQNARKEPPVIGALGIVWEKL